MDISPSRSASDLNVNKDLLRKYRTAVQDILEPHHDDQYLFRWLKARDFNLVKAEKMIRESFKFRKRIGADSILTDFDPPEVFHKYCNFTTRLGFDNENNLVRVVMTGQIDCKGLIRSLSLAECMKLLMHVMEGDIQFVKEKQKENGNIDEKMIYILDHTDFSLRQVYDKTVIYTGIQLLKMYQDNYPELLKAAYVTNVPYYFNWWYGLFKPILHPSTQSKIKIFGPNQYEEVLRSIMDPKILPAFMGGELTDPDGDPKCQTLLKWNAKVDPSYYVRKKVQRNDNEMDPSVKLVTIQARSIFRIPVEAKTTGSIVKWKFWTKEYNVRFGLFFMKNDSSTVEELLPVDVVECDIFPEDNEYCCEKMGIYILHFDNSYSWFRSKRVWYKVDVESPDV